MSIPIATTPPRATEEPTVSRSGKLTRRALDNLVWIILIVLVVAFSVGVDGFFSARNFVNIVYHGVFIGILAIAETYCLITGKMDLSIESTAAFSAMLAAWVMGTSQFASGFHLPTELAVPLVLAFGCVVGLINAALIVKLKIDAFLVTLSMYILVRGLALWLTEGKGVSLLPTSFRLLDTVQIIGIPLMVYIMVAFYLFFFFVLVDVLRSPSVRHRQHRCRLQARRSGGSGDREGVRPQRGAGRLHRPADRRRADGATAASATWFLFDVLAAIVIGGVSLKGGEGSLVGVFAGVLLLSVIRSALNIMAISPFITDVVRGLLVMFAIVLDSAKRMLR